MKKLISDTLKNRDGKYSRKSITLLVAFSSALIYEFFMPIFFGLLEMDYLHNEYVFKSLLVFTELLFFGTIADKKL
ncbi:MAG: hypothetical protein WD512_20200 [Candidatus Paceibacterota bacterium]